MDKKNINPLFGLGTINETTNQYFTNTVYLNQLNNNGINAYNVTFIPGCRNNWHIHSSTENGGQLLLCTDGFGWYQEENKPARKLKPGDVVYIAPNVKHWHGATKDSYFTHVGIDIPGKQTKTIWLEKVEDSYYNNL